MRLGFNPLAPTGNADLDRWAKSIYDLLKNSIDYGTYTPVVSPKTVSAGGNVISATAGVCQWMRIGDVVTVSGQLDADPNAANTLSQIGIQLPIASNFANASQCAGAASGSLSNESGVIYADATMNRAELWWYPTSDTSRNMYFTFTYSIVA